MPRYELTVDVQYVYEVEADSREAAEEQGWAYEDYPFSASVYSIDVGELEEEEEEEEEEDEDND